MRLFCCGDGDLGSKMGGAMREGFKGTLAWRKRGEALLLLLLLFHLLLLLGAEQVAIDTSSISEEGYKQQEGWVLSKNEEENDAGEGQGVIKKESHCCLEVVLVNRRRMSCFV